jgi:hypothetical protein
MKKLISAAALGVLAASPVLAQTDEQRTPSNSTEARSAVTRTVRPQEPRRNRANDVYTTSGHYVGSDPDSKVRTMLQLDQFQDGD